VVIKRWQQLLRPNKLELRIKWPFVSGHLIVNGHFRYRSSTRVLDKKARQSSRAVKNLGKHLHHLHPLCNCQQSLQSERSLSCLHLSSAARYSRQLLTARFLDIVQYFFDASRVASHGGCKDLVIQTTRRCCDN